MIDPRIKLRHITSFLEVIRQGGVVAAGNVLGLSQPAVSKSIAELEDILGTALFDRTGRKLALNGNGETFLRYANAALTALGQGVETLAGGGGGENQVRIGALPTVEAEVVPQAVARFAMGALSSRVHVESGPSPHLLALLRAGTIDFVVGRMPHPDVMSGLVFEHLYSEDLVLAVRSTHPLCGHGTLSLRAVERYCVLTPPRGAIIRPIVEALLVAAAIGPLSNEIETVSNSFGRAYTLLTDAVWIISRSVVAADLEKGDLVALDIDMSASHGPVGITTRAGSEFDLSTIALIEAVRAVVAER